MSIIDLFDKLKKLKIQYDYQLKIEEENRKKAVKARWISVGLCELCGGSIVNDTCVKCNHFKGKNIGDVGPAGGIIFYDKGSKSDGWRYLEAAPANTEFRAEWGAYYKDVSGTRTEIGYGKSNTQIIAKFLNNIGETNKAAQRCLALNINGHNDWFLPSKDELNEMYKQRNIISGFNVDAEFDNASVYWSSSQGSGYYNYAWNQYFNNGNQNYTFKNSNGMVRAVRAF